MPLINTIYATNSFKFPCLKISYLQNECIFLMFSLNLEPFVLVKGYTNIF
jgi:hypothetical protein